MLYGGGRLGPAKLDRGAAGGFFGGEGCAAEAAAYQAEDQATRDAWDAAIKGKGVAMTGFNYYLGLYVKYLIENSGTPPTPPFMPPS